VTAAASGGHGPRVRPSARVPAGAAGTGASAPPDETDAFADAYARYHDGVRRTLGCLGVPPSQLDDAVQEVFLVVHRRSGDPDRYATLREWIYGVARRVAWRHHRTRSRYERRVGLVEPPEPPAGPDVDVERDEAVAFVRAFLDTLDPDQRDAFVFAEIEGLGASEIAAIVGANVNTVSSRLRLARARFETALVRRRARERREAR
jgi:RNA polymerase sigma-70 factor (ECF subfamily)